MASLNDSITWISGNLKENAWIIQVFVIIFFTAVVQAVQSVIMRRLYTRLTQTNNIWDDAFVGALQKPLAMLIWVCGISFAFKASSSMFVNSAIFEMISPITRAIVLGLLTWFMIRFVNNVEEQYLNPPAGSKQYDKTTVHVIGQLLSLSILITACLVGLQMFGFPVSMVFAFGGVGSVVVGFAAKDLLANFFGGLMIYLDRPFKLGDWIRSPDRDIEGTVEAIGWRLTRIRTFDKRPLYVPNNVFSTISVQNPSRMTNRRIYTKVGLRYEDASKISVILKDIRQMLASHPDIDTKQTLMVNLIEFGSSALNFMIYTFTKTTNWVEFQAIQEDVFLKVIDIITSHGAECAFPTTTLHVPEAIHLNEASQHFTDRAAQGNSILT